MLRYGVKWRRFAYYVSTNALFHHNGDGGIQIGLGKDTLSANPDPENLAAYNKVINCDFIRNARSGQI